METARGAFLLPYQQRVVIRERAVAVVRVTQRRPVHPIAREDGARLCLARRQVRLTRPQVRRARPQAGGAATEVAGAGTQLPLCLRQADSAAIELRGTGIQAGLARRQAARIACHGCSGG